MSDTFRILHIDASPRSGSDTRAISRTLVEALAARHTGAQVQYRDLSLTPPTHVSEAWLAGAYGADTPEARAAIAESDALIRELEEADAIVLGIPMYNFAVPSTVKAWIDQIVRSGKTFAYDNGGFRGLLADRPVYVALSRSGDYRPDGPLAAIDFQQPYLKHMLGFVGLRDVHFVVHVHQQDEAANRARLEERIAEARALVSDATALV